MGSIHTFFPTNYKIFKKKKKTSFRGICLKLQQTLSLGPVSFLTAKIEKISVSENDLRIVTDDNKAKPKMSRGRTGSVQAPGQAQ